jgi:hypothetical protein
VAEINQGLTAAGITTITAAASGTQYVAFTITDNMRIEGNITGTPLATIGLTAGFYAYWKPIDVPNSIKMGFLEFDRERLHLPGQTAANTFQFAKGKRYKDFELTMYVQTDDWLAYLDQIDDGKTGSLLPSFTFHTEIPAENSALIYWDIIVAIPNKISLDVSKEDSFQTVSFLWLDTVATAAYTNILPFDFDTYPKIFPSAFCSIDGDDLSSSLEKFNIEFTLGLWDFIGSSSWLRSPPQFLTLDIDLKVEGYEDLSNTIALLNTYTYAAKTIIAGFGTGFRLQVTNMWPDTSNEGEIDDKLDAYKHTYELKNSGPCEVDLI